MTPILFVDYTFTLLHDGSIIMDNELKPNQIDLKNGDIFYAYVNGDRIYLKKYKPAYEYQDNKSAAVLYSGSISG